MKIISKIDSEAWKYKFNCNNCKSELEADSNDVKYHYSEGDGSHPSSEYYSISCPVCHNHHTLNTGDPQKVPVVILIKAKSKYRPLYGGSGRD